MIRNQRRRLIKSIDRQLKTISKTVNAWQKIRKASTKQEDIANADNAIKHLVNQAIDLFGKRKSLVLNKSALRPSDVQEDIPEYPMGEQIF
jgi:cell fate (sporulation/competence/biofilm development) regulator YmcA (YheA/YmcA/DUF963 family)